MMIKRLTLLIGMAVLAACTATVPIVETKKETKPYVYIPEEYVSISCVTHGTGYIHSFAIEEPVHSGPIGGRMAGGASCGGIIAAGYALPKTWFPGMKVKVRWNRPIKGVDSWHEKTTNIMRYGEAGTITVHFFSNDQVRVVSSARYAPESPKHPIPEDALIPPPEEQ
ncbi:hypothetical protein F506_12385 [Herbaspirillum hiltneri N3]|uniref:DUF3304 domain-containing protein n=1 Tax=Herbaspirillum hiltneri N3 TaxID=1262470 RepID=A0ABM5V1E3_9BURK|nr:DUF3304 domain-containing protein [Herbaspirillum hiltneri]AKZ63361.1 hypothetical protein F506_12385 [Herbaspirillum hiltneri N3]